MGASLFIFTVQSFKITAVLFLIMRGAFPLVDGQVLPLLMIFYRHFIVFLSVA